MKRTGLPCVLLVFIAGQIPALVKAQTAPSLRSSTSLVVVPVSVFDRSGRSVSGLEAQDFELLVDGKPATISSFEIVVPGGNPLAAPAPAKAAARKVFSNISLRTANQPTLVVLLVDYLNTRLVDRMNLREALLKFLSTKLQPQQEIGLYGLTHSLVALYPFTKDPSSLIAAAKKLLDQKGQPSDPKESVALVKPGLDPLQILAQPGTDQAMEYLSATNARREYNMDQEQRAARTLAAFRTLAASLSGLSGKKVVIWLTGDASPLNPTLLYRNLVLSPSVQSEAMPAWQIAKTYELLNAAGTSVFPVDIRGLQNAGSMRAEQTATRDEFIQSLGGSQAADLSPYANPTELRQGEAANAILAMDSVAAETGGVVLSGSNDVENLIDRAQGLWGSHYVLTFVPEKIPDNALPSYHKINVKVRRKGIRVLARRGYLTRPLNRISGPEEISADMQEAVNSPVDLNSLPLELELGPANGVPDLHRIPFALTVSGGVLGPQAEGTSPFDLMVAMLVRDSENKILSSAAKRIRSSIGRTDLARASSKGLKLDLSFESPATKGPCFGRVIVRDNLTGRVGTISLTLRSAGED